MKIKFKNKFDSPDRIYGTPKQLEELGIKVLGTRSKDSIAWNYECIPIKMTRRTFNDVKIDWNDEHDCCDIEFSNGVIFGYIDDTDFKII